MESKLVLAMSCLDVKAKLTHRYELIHYNARYYEPLVADMEHLGLTGSLCSGLSGPFSETAEPGRYNGCFALDRGIVYKRAARGRKPTLTDGRAHKPLT